jgi:hypothetical protein
MVTLTYFVFVLIQSAYSSYRFKDTTMLLIAPITYILTHLGYGLGFLKGAIT